MTKHKAGVIGSPVSHSLSPTMHNAAYAHLDLDWEYSAIELENTNIVQQIMELFDQGYKGLNVTMPYKEIAFDVCHPHTQASRIGSVNTLIPGPDGEIHGYSTDGQGFIDSCVENSIELKNKSVLVIGAGGASRSICDALEKARANVYVTSRKLDKAMEIVTAIVTRRIQHQIDPLGSIDVVEFSQRNNFLERCDVIVNATPVGMTKDSKTSNETPIDVDKINSEQIVIDTIYHPTQTALLLGASEKGAKTFNGIEMLVHQGALAFNLMTGCEAPVEIMKQAIIEKLSESTN